MNLLTLTLAHGGHGHTSGDSLWHYLIEPAHLPYSLSLAALVVAGVAFAVWRNRKA
jgi:hypothetical protein